MNGLDSVQLIWTQGFPLEDFDKLEPALQLKGKAVLFRIFTAKPLERQKRGYYEDPKLIYIGSCAKEGYIQCLENHNKNGDFERWSRVSNGPVFFSLAGVEVSRPGKKDPAIGKRQEFARALADEWAFCLVYRLRPLCNKKTGSYKGRDLEIVGQGDWKPFPSPIICTSLARIAPQIPPLSA